MNSDPAENVELLLTLLHNDLQERGLEQGFKE
jgi:hypothetical protein